MQICQDSCFEIFFFLHLLSLWAVAKPLRDMWFSFLSGSLVSEVCRCRVVENSEGRCWSGLMCGGALWEGTQELFVYFLQRNFDMGMQIYANKAWQPLTDFRGPGRRRGRGEVNRQKPIHCRAWIQACHSADRDERGPTCRDLHRKLTSVWHSVGEMRN